MQLDILLIPFGFYGMVWWDGVPHENGIKNQWPFQEPKLEVSTIYEAYIRPMKGISPENMAKNMVQYLHFRILKFPLKC